MFVHHPGQNMCSRRKEGVLLASRSSAHIRNSVTKGSKDLVGGLTSWSFLSGSESVRLSLKSGCREARSFSKTTSVSYHLGTGLWSLLKVTLGVRGRK